MSDHTDLQGPLKGQSLFDNIVSSPEYVHSPELRKLAANLVRRGWAKPLAAPPTHTAPPLHKEGTRGSILGELAQFGRNAASDAAQIAVGTVELPEALGHVGATTGDLLYHSTAGAIDEIPALNRGRFANEHAQYAANDVDELRDIVGGAFGAGQNSGILTDLATATGSAAGGQRGWAKRQMRQIGSNVLQYS